MKELLVVLVFVSILLLFAYAYSNQPNETMSSLYQKIPEQVRENSQLIAAYYSSQTGFGGFREYQFALYNPNDRTISIYTFKISKLLKIWPRITENKITCKTQLNYSILATSPEKLKNFKNCGNCRILLYKDRIYKNGEIESIYPSIEQVIRGKENTTYVKLSLLKDSEITTGAVGFVIGDMGFYTDDVYYGRGLLYLPSPIVNLTRGVVVEFLPVDNETIKRVIHYPGNVTLSDEFKITKYYRVNITRNLTWTLKEVPIEQILQKLDSKQLQKTIGEDSRVRLEISKEPLWAKTPKLEAWLIWIDKGKTVYIEKRIYPTEKTYKEKFSFISGYYCGW
ncbi:hypothetical protein [Thermococcus gammatolerans]|nr:hypothetical protein [Thermococcus gammatolerans]